MDAIGIGRSGLDASLLRMTASAANVANANATGPVPGSPAAANGARAYQPLRVEAAPLAGGAVQARLVPSDPAYRLTYEPGSRHADAKGMVAAPAVDIASEMVEQLSAKLAFEANLKVISTASDLTRRSTELWG